MAIFDVTKSMESDVWPEQILNSIIIKCNITYIYKLFSCLKSNISRHINILMFGWSANWMSSYDPGNILKFQLRDV